MPMRRIPLTLQTLTTRRNGANLRPATSRRTGHFQSVRSGHFQSELTIKSFDVKI